MVGLIGESRDSKQPVSSRRFFTNNFIIFVFEFLEERTHGHYATAVSNLLNWKPKRLHFISN